MHGAAPCSTQRPVSLSCRCTSGGWRAPPLWGRLAPWWGVGAVDQGLRAAARARAGWGVGTPSPMIPRGVGVRDEATLPHYPNPKIETYLTLHSGFPVGTQTPKSSPTFPHTQGSDLRGSAVHADPAVSPPGGLDECPRRLAARTPGFHPGKAGSIPAEGSLARSSSGRTLGSGPGYAGSNPALATSFTFREESP
jgi:hypothetical protein